jgi:hypothetical protein
LSSCVVTSECVYFFMFSTCCIEGIGILYLARRTFS